MQDQLDFQIVKNSTHKDEACCERLKDGCSLESLFLRLLRFTPVCGFAVDVAKK
jgi:hypothetical protein